MISSLQDFITIFLSIVIESLLFVVIGIFVSIFVALYIPESTILKLLPKNRYISHLLLSFLGMLAPVCQCGNVPVVRRMIMKGMSVSQSMTFLLAAPIVNPLTLATTWEAFRYNHSIAIIRLLGGFLIAYCVGIFLSFNKNQNNLLTQSFIDECKID